MMNKLLLFLTLLSFSNLFSQQPYGIQRGQRGYIPPPKFESSVYITTIDSYEELNKTLPSCIELFSLDDFDPLRCLSGSAVIRLKYLIEKLLLLNYSNK